ncbi:MAG: rod shape-determining protein MreC [Methylococcales bacterium]|nr:rod shape-determining protein MreC [Methylococcales bacterium]
MFSEDSSINLRLLLAVLVSIALMTFSQRSNYLSPLRSALSIAVYPVQFLASLPQRIGDGSATYFAKHKTLIQENHQLRKKLLVHQTRLLKASALEKENIRLRNLLDSSFKLGEQILVSELLSVNLDPYKHTVVIDKGQRFGVFNGQPVLDTWGIIGQVYRTGLLHSEVILISDPGHAIPIQVNRNGLRTIAVGTGKINELSLPFLPNHSEIKAGDLLISSGLGGTFPQGYPVGVVNEVIPQPDKPFSLINARPTAHLDRSRELLLVWTNKQSIALLPDGQSQMGSQPSSDELLE